MRKSLIVDLDNTLFDSTELEKYIPVDKHDRAGWDLYATKYYLVKPNKWCVGFIKKYKDDYRIIFMTAREDTIKGRLDTIKEINKVLPELDYILHMRPYNNFDNSDVVKLNLYNNRIKDYYEVEFAIDDDEQNCKMFIKQGIKTIYCGKN